MRVFWWVVKLDDIFEGEELKDKVNLVNILLVFVFRVNCVLIDNRIDDDNYIDEFVRDVDINMVEFVGYQFRNGIYGYLVEIIIEICDVEICGEVCWVVGCGGDDEVDVVDGIVEDENDMLVEEIIVCVCKNEGDGVVGSVCRYCFICQFIWFLLEK